MYRIGQPEIKRVENLLESGEIFRYGKAGECDQFEADWGKRLGGVQVRMTTSGTASLFCALIVGLKVGPGDSVIVPSCTYMATALAVVAAGARPIIAEVDESITLSPEDVEQKIAPHTKSHHSRAYVGIALQYGRADGHCGKTRSKSIGRCVPGRGRWIQRARTRIHRACRGIQL